MRVLFVHGTGVRRKEFDATFDLVSQNLVQRLPDVDLVPCYWGDDHGASLAAGGQSIPARRETRAVQGQEPSVSPLDEEAAEWALLLVDPMCELRVLAELGKVDDELGVPGVRAAVNEVASRIAALPRFVADEDELSVVLRSTGVADHYPGALKRVATSAELGDACAQAQDAVATREVAGAAARAIAAVLLASDDAVCTGDERDRIVDLLADRLGGTDRGRASRAAAALGTLALRLTTQPALNYWRRPLTEGSVPKLGDILRYQARGGPLRAFLEEQIATVDAPTVVIGHSLGGIALVDLLASNAARETPLPGVRLLVTVGSQAPFLHELGALAGLPPGASLPNGFPTWLNVFDRQDLLSFVAAPVFTDVRVRDHEVSSRQPFPLSHSAYWKLDSTYDAITAAMAVTG
ncbi:hypothetical protein [Amycolatopsis thailandensis]|uniref:hypothetical protein n=1 Tax=Amycolatopsis thailandensis TaxID=589330 RepID=UPI0036351421